MGFTVTEPSVTLKVTVLKFVLVLEKLAALRPMEVVPASVCFASAVPLKTMSDSLNRVLLMFVTVYPVASCSVPS